MITMNDAFKMVGLQPVLIQIFRYIELAEEVIAEQKRLYDFDDSKVFRLAAPDDNLREATELVYRAHVRELCIRVAHGTDTRVATDAEVVWALYNMALHAPLNNDATVAYYGLGNGLFNWSETIQMEVSESYPGAALEIESKIRSRLINIDSTLGRYSFSSEASNILFGFEESNSLGSGLLHRTYQT